MVCNITSRLPSFGSVPYDRSRLPYRPHPHRFIQPRECHGGATCRYSDIAVIAIESASTFVSGIKAVGPLLFLAGALATMTPVFAGLWLEHKIFKFPHVHYYYRSRTDNPRQLPSCHRLHRDVCRKQHYARYLGTSGSTSNAVGLCIV